MIINQNKVTFKNLFWFHIASNSLLLSGATISNNSSLWILWLLIWCNISGLFLIYRFNECIVPENKLRLNIYRFFSFPSHLIIFIQLVCCAIPIAFIFLEKDIFLSTLFIRCMYGFFIGVLCFNFTKILENKIPNFFTYFFFILSLLSVSFYRAVDLPLFLIPIVFGFFIFTLVNSEGKNYLKSILNNNYH